MAIDIRSPLLHALKHQAGTPQQLLNFFDSARSIDWRSILTYAEKTIDLLVYKWPHWVDEHEQELTAFLSRPGTKVRLVMSDPRNIVILKELRKLYPDHSEPQLVAKIVGTQQKLNAIVDKIQGPKGSVECFLLPRMISYPCQRIDDEVVIFSFFGMDRQGKTLAPATIVSLNDSPQLRQFFDREWEVILKEALRCDLSKILNC